MCIYVTFVYSTAFGCRPIAIETGHTIRAPLCLHGGGFGVTSLTIRPAQNKDLPALSVRCAMVSCPLCGESHRKDNKSTCERIHREKTSVIATRGKGKSYKSVGRNR